MSQSNNWKETYNNVLSFFKIPKLNPELRLADIKDIEVSFSDLFVDLYEFFSNFKIQPETQIFRIYADVVYLSKTLEIQLSNDSCAILIVARQFEIEPNCQIIIKNCKKFFRLIIYTAKMSSELEIIANNVSNKFEINDSENFGKILSIRNGKSPEFKDITTFDNIILKNNSFFKILQYSLNIAIALFYDNPEITRSILFWIRKITRHSEREELKELFDHTSTIVTKLYAINKRKNDNILFVPPLDKRIYKERIDEYMKFANDYEEKLTQVLNDKQNLESLNVTLKNCRDKEKMHEYLNHERKDRYEKALDLMNKIENELQRRKYAEMELVVAVVELALCVGRIVYQPGNVSTFITIIGNVGNSFREALEGFDLESFDLNKIMTPCEATQGKEILNQIDEADIDDEISRIVDLSNQLKRDLKDVNKMSNSLIKDQRGIESLDFDTLTKELENDKKGIHLSAQWEFTRRQMMKLLELPIRENLKRSEEFHNPKEPSFEGAEDYLLSLENFFIFIDAYIKAKVEEIESHEEFMRTSKHAEMSKKKSDRIDQLIKKYESNNYDEIKFQLIEHLINSKFWMMIYMEDYLCAYEYWSLSKPEIKPSIIKSFHDLEKDMNKIRDELEKAYVQFGCGPNLNWSLIKFDEKKYIEEFRNNRSVIIEIPLNCEELSKYAHINLHAFRVYLEGVGSENEIISLCISNTGTLANRDKKNQIHYFRARPIPANEFRYRENSSLNSSVEFDKTEKYIDHDNKYKNDDKIYFVPTPFCQWKISLNTKNDLSKLRSINIHLVTYCHMIV
ncbi:23951_t:CDS:2 [Gigaspora rosea]|nr:23951_t:CDS:2 [Gigaspora rosea]